LALHIRTLVRDTPRSKSLLGQLGSAFTWTFVDSVIVPLETITDQGPYHGLMSIHMAGGKVEFEPLCFSETDRPARRRSFLDWWTRMVMRDTKGGRYTREDLVLVVANQDGGGHVDPSIDEAYGDLSRDGSLGITFEVTGPQPRRWTQNPVPPAIRQIAQEVLWTLENQGLAEIGPN